LEEQISAPDTGSIFAAEGTFIHEASEARLLEIYFPNNGKVHPYANPKVGEVCTVDGFEIEWDDSMQDAMEAYVAYIGLIRGTTEHCTIGIEQRVKLTEDVWGTADCILWFPEIRHLDVIDLKGGRGVLVEADTDQLLVYALAAVETFGYPALTVDTHVVQPRGKTTDGAIHRVARHTLLDLLEYQDNILNPGLEKLRARDMTLASGDHCRFCKAKPICPQLKQDALAVAKMEFADEPPKAGTLSDAELADTLDKAELIAAWVTSLRAEASARIDRGATIPRWKLVPKRGTRKWASEKDAYDYLTTTFGLSEKEIMEQKILSVAQFAKRHKEVYAQIEGQLVTKESSGTTLVREDDARDAAPTGPSSEFEKII
jgi:hypothetical protein